MDSGCRTHLKWMVLLVAGGGSRMGITHPKPKCLMEINGRTLLDLQFEHYQRESIEGVILVLGYQAALVRQHAERLASHHRLKIAFAHNDNYQTQGNTYSLYLGLKEVFNYNPHEVFISDADLCFEASVLNHLVVSAAENALLVGPSSLSDIECAKTLVDSEGWVRKTVDKRAVTAEELQTMRFVGEAVGILKFSPSSAQRLLSAAQLFLSVPSNLTKNWEHLLNDFLPSEKLCPILLDSHHKWIEIDTEEDYKRAQVLFS